MEIDMNKSHWYSNKCPKYDCRKESCKCGLKYVNIPASLGDDSKDSPVAPTNGAYCNAFVKYDANGALYAYTSEGVPVKITANLDELKEQLDELAEIVETKADKTALEDLSIVVGTKASQSDLDALTVVVNAKALQSDLDALTLVVNTKADKSSVDALSAEVSDKADKSDLAQVAFTGEWVDVEHRPDQFTDEGWNDLWH